MNERLARKIAADHAAGKHKGAPRFDCWACGAGLTSAMPQRESLYPDRERAFCQRCRCEHFKGGRCFTEDPVGWPIVREIVGMGGGGFVSRMTPAETVRAVKGEKAPEPAPESQWWVE